MVEDIEKNSQKSKPDTSNEQLTDVGSNQSGPTASESDADPLTDQNPLDSSSAAAEKATNLDDAAIDSGFKRNYRKVRRGLVVSDKMNRTIVVEVIDRVRHPLYGKIVRRSKKFHADDQGNQAKVGDLVTIMETRPISKTKHFRLLEIIEKAK
jgi:small subunit ribosomal protein S17